LIIKKSAGDTRRKLPNITLIDERPEDVNVRIIPGDWEGDLIIGKDYKSVLSLIVEPRHVMIDRLEGYTALEVRKSTEKRLTTLKPEVVKSITCDQWEKGTCEKH